MFCLWVSLMTIANDGIDEFSSRIQNASKQDYIDVE